MTTLWHDVSLGEVLTARQEKPSEEDLLSGRIRIVSKISFADGRIQFRSDSHSKTGMILVRPGDLLVSGINAYKGAIAVYDPKAEQPAAATIHYSAYAVTPDHGDPRFLWHLLRSRVFRENLERAVPGGIKTELKASRLLRVPIPLPPLAEQRRIVTRIDELAVKLDEASTLRQKAAEEAEAFAAAASRKVFSDTWPRTQLEELCPVITDGTHQTPQYTEEGAVFLSAQNVKPFRFMPENHRKVSLDDFRAYTARNKPQRGDVLLTRVGAGIGEAAVVDQDIEFAIYVSLALIRTDKERLLPEFLVHWLNSPAGRESSNRETLGRGHSQGNLNLKLLRAFLLPVPPVSEQRRIVAALDALRAKVDALKGLQNETAAELDALFPSILDRAFSGEL